MNFFFHFLPAQPYSKEAQQEGNNPLNRPPLPPNWWKLVTCLDSFQEAKHAFQMTAILWNPLEIQRGKWSVQSILSTGTTVRQFGKQWLKDTTHHPCVPLMHWRLSRCRLGGTQAGGPKGPAEKARCGREPDSLHPPGTPHCSQAPVYPNDPQKNHEKWRSRLWRHWASDAAKEVKKVLS